MENINNQPTGNVETSKKKNINKGLFLGMLIGIIIGVLLSLIIVYALGLDKGIYSTSSTGESIETPESKDTMSSNTKESMGQYRFRAVKEEPSQPTQRYSGYYVDVLKGDQLIKRVSLRDDRSNPEITYHTIETPREFVISPNEQYVAFIGAYAGGTCVYGHKPLVINLEDFTVSEMNRPSENSQPDTLWMIEDIEWTSNNEILANVYSERCGTGEIIDDSIEWRYTL